MSRVLRVLVVAVVGLGFLGAIAREIAADDQSSASTRGLRSKVVRVQQKAAKKKARPARSAAKSESEGETPAKSEAAKPAGPADGSLKFSRDIAPILVANCFGCHNHPKQKRVKLDMSTFELLMKGTADHAVITPGKPEESHLVLRIKGEETPKMPQGANRTLSSDAIEKIEKWVKAGAILDANIDPKAEMEKYAATPEDLRKAELARMSPEIRDKKVETVGLERWKKADPKVAPEVTPSTHFLLFSTLPKARATAATKSLETQVNHLKTLLGPSALDLGEKISLYVFNDKGSFGEFVKAVENREVESGDVGTARFSVPEPYVAVIDPQGGRDESPTATAAPRRAGKSKRGEMDSGGAERSLAGVLTEHLVIGALGHAGKPPRWLALGLGAQVASRVEPRAAYFQKIRREAATLNQQGWVPKANEALGDATKAEEVRAVGFAIVESMLGSEYRVALPQFIRGMSAGGDKLDTVLGEVLGMDRAHFLNGTGEFVAARYGAGR